MDKIGIIVQARLTSKRFPNKILSLLNGKPVIQHTLEKLMNFPFQVIVAIPDTKTNDSLADWLDKNNYSYFRGSEYDVTQRFLDCAFKYKFNVIIRICGDSVMINGDEIWYTLNKFRSRSKWLEVGMGVQVMSFEALEYVADNCVWLSYREHVWTFLENTINYPDDLKRVGMVLDTKDKPL